MRYVGIISILYLPRLHTTNARRSYEKKNLALNWKKKLVDDISWKLFLIQTTQIYLALLVPGQAECLLHFLEQTAKGISLYVN